MPYKPPIPPEKIYPNANPLAIEMLQRLLVFNPSKRITVDEAPARVLPRLGPAGPCPGAEGRVQRLLRLCALLHAARAS